ncbi:MAG: hypothetical protein ACI9P7_001109 [Candidatus Azotimanducaceae bacterium]|jgi:hypothetical protein
MARSKKNSGMVDDSPEVESVDDNLIELSVNARHLAIRRRIEDSIEAKRIREELGYDLD